MHQVVDAVEDTLQPALPAAMPPQRRFRASVLQMLSASVGPMVAAGMREDATIGEHLPFWERTIDL